jgi:hypothetical protein
LIRAALLASQVLCDVGGGGDLVVEVRTTRTEGGTENELQGNRDNRSGVVQPMKLFQLACASTMALLFLSAPIGAASRFPQICQTNGKFVWADGKAPVSDEMLRAIIREEGSFTAGNCSCIDLRRDCEAETPGQCLPSLRECNTAIGSGGSFCKANSLGGQTCYR